MQQQQQQAALPQQSYMQSSMPQMVAPGCGGLANNTIYMPVDQGASFAVPTTTFLHHHNHYPTPHHHHAHQAPPTRLGPRATHAHHAGRSANQGKVGGAGEESATNGEGPMETSTAISDVSLSSEVGGGGRIGGEGGAEDGDVASTRTTTDDDCGSTQEGEEDAGGISGGGCSGASERKTGLVKGKRKYYMYGPHKLIKPIKEIPPRFQMLLAANSAAKARCEGQPIYMQLSPADLVALDPGDPAMSGLNADAQCFYPGPVHHHQAYDAIVLDENGMATFANGCQAPPPILLPHPHQAPPPMGVGSAPVSVVYSAASFLGPASSASALPPPNHLHPSSAFAMPTCSTSSTMALPREGGGNIGSCSGGGLGGEGKLIPVVVGVTSVNKGSACSGREKRAEELAGPSLSSCNGAGGSGGGGKVAVCSSHLSMSSSFTLSPATAAFPSVMSSALPPPPPSHPPPHPALHAGSVHPNAPPSGVGGKQCFYMYSSPSAGYPPTAAALPAPMGHGQGQGPSQGQLVYVMNPAGYGPAPPPCTAYQPTLMAPPTAHSMGVACPTVAVQ